MVMRGELLGREREKWMKGVSVWRWIISRLGSVYRY